MNRAPKIAIVDDDEGVRLSLSSLVRSLGYDVRTYGSASEFLDDHDIGDPDCMITDMQMPRMTGEQLQTRLNAAARTFPIVFITAFPTEAARHRVVANESCAYLVKPVDGTTIAHCLAAALERPRA